MHIPDGFLSTPVWASLNAVSVPAIGYLARRAQSQIDESLIPLLGVMGAFVFAAQMINFPVGVGTSGHLIGSALLATTMGPAAATIIMTAILVIQALVFQDGGILALGANVFNMAVVGVLAGYLPYHYAGNSAWRRAAVVAGGILSVLAGALLAIAQLAVSGVRLPGAVLNISLGLFVVTAILEGLITLVVFEAIERLNPRWVQTPQGSNRALGVLAAIAILLAVVGVLFASQSPDVLEGLADRAGFAGQARTLLETPVGDYEFKGWGSAWFSKAAAGLVGIGVVYLSCALFARWLRTRSGASPRH